MKEYKTVVIQTGGDVNKLKPVIDDVLNKMANAGWELKFIERVFFIFEREKN